MKLLATLKRGYEAEWRVRISPRKMQDGTYDASTVSFWTPPDGSAEDRMLIYNPTIGITVRNRFNKGDGILIPITLLYALSNKLMIVYNNLNTKGLYTTDGSKLYIDAKLADKAAVKLMSYRDTIIFYPVKVSVGSGEEIKAIRIVANGKTIADMRHDEVRELCETLDHLDIQTFSLILSMMEQMNYMDEKLDRILQTQSEILQILKEQGLSHNKIQTPSYNQSNATTVAGLEWQRVM